MRRNLLTRERLIATAIAIVLGGAAAMYLLRWLEWSITFHPVRTSVENRSQPPPGAEDVWFNANDGTRLHGWFFRSAGQPRAATIVYFHGNGGNISNVGWVGQRFARRGFDVLLFDYRGYGASDGRAGEESGLYADGDAAVAFVIKEKGAIPEELILYGQSLGTAVVVDVASRRHCGAVILESGFSSASSVATSVLPWLPTSLHFLGKNKFDSASKLEHVKAPVLITHGEPDPVIPSDESRKLYAAASEPKKFLIFPGAGHNVFGSQGEPYLREVEQFIRESLQDTLPPEPGERQ